LSLKKTEQFTKDGHHDMAVLIEILRKSIGELREELITRWMSKGEFETIKSYVSDLRSAHGQNDKEKVGGHENKRSRSRYLDSQQYKNTSKKGNNVAYNAKKGDSSKMKVPENWEKEFKAWHEELGFIMDHSYLAFRKHFVVELISLTAEQDVNTSVKNRECVKFVQDLLKSWKEQSDKETDYLWFSDSNKKKNVEEQDIIATLVKMNNLQGNTN
jgi:hypothetical protein